MGESSSDKSERELKPTENGFDLLFNSGFREKLPITQWGRSHLAGAEERGYGGRGQVAMGGNPFGEVLLEPTVCVIRMP